MVPQRHLLIMYIHIYVCNIYIYIYIYIYKTGRYEGAIAPIIYMYILLTL